SKVSQEPVFRSELPEQQQFGSPSACNGAGRIRRSEGGMTRQARNRRETATGGRTGRPWLLGRLARPIRRVLGHYMFSSLTRRILILNFGAIAVLVVGILYINQFRDALIDAQVESLKTQGEIIAGAIAGSATVETDTILVDPEKLLELQAGESLPLRSNRLENLSFPINPEVVAPLLRRLISPTKTRARVYDGDANLIYDTRQLTQILRYELPPLEAPEPSLWERVRSWFTSFFLDNSLPIDREQPGGSGVGYEEVMNALNGGTVQAVRRRSEKGEYIISVAVPIQRYRVVVGA